MAITIEDPWTYRAWETLDEAVRLAWRAQAAPVDLGMPSGVHVLALEPLPAVVERPGDLPVLLTPDAAEPYVTLEAAKKAAERLADSHLPEDTPPHADVLTAPEGQPGTDPGSKILRLVAELERRAEWHQEQALQQQQRADAMEDMVRAQEVGLRQHQDELRRLRGIETTAEEQAATIADLLQQVQRLRDELKGWTGGFEVQPEGVNRG